MGWRGVSSGQTTSSHPCKGGVGKYSDVKDREVREAARSVGERLATVFERLGSPQIRRTFVSVMEIRIAGSLSCYAMRVDTVRNLSETGRTIGNLGSTSNFVEQRLKRELRLHRIPRLVFRTASDVRCDTGVDHVLGDLSVGRSRRRGSRSM